MDGCGRETVVDRRCFLKGSAAAGAWALSGPVLRRLGLPADTLEASDSQVQAAAPGLRIVRLGLKRVLQLDDRGCAITLFEMRLGRRKGLVSASSATRGQRADDDKCSDQSKKFNLGHESEPNWGGN